MFWVYLKVSAILRVPGTPPGLRYTSGSQVHVALHVLAIFDIFEGTCKPLGPRYIPGCQVHLRVSSTRCASCFEYIWRYLQSSGSQVHPRVPGIPPVPRYTPGSQVHPRVPGTPPVPRYTLGSQVHPRLPGTPPGLRYTSRFMFWLYLKVPASLRVSGTPPGLLIIIRSLPHLQRSSRSPQVQRIFILARGLGDLTPNGPGALGATGLT